MPAPKLIHNGSRKNLYLSATDPDRLWIEFLDNPEVSPLDEGKGVIANKGRADAIISAHLFECLSNPLTWSQIPASPFLLPIRADWLDRRWHHLIFSHVLSEHGAPTHYRALVNKSGRTASNDEVAEGPGPHYMEVVAARGILPQPLVLLGKTVYCYNARASKTVRPYTAKETGTEAAAKPVKNLRRRLIPLKVFFHLGLPPGGSFLARLLADPLHVIYLDLQKAPRQEQLLERPVLEFWTKDEEISRLLNIQEALLVSELSPGEFEEMIETSYAVALALHVLLGSKGLNLWAGKLEYAITDEGLMLVDSIGTEELAMSYERIGITGLTMKEVYSQSMIDKCAAGNYKNLSRGLCSMLANQITGQKLFADLPVLDSILQTTN